MSKIQQLIDQYCPHGVEYKKLGEVCVIQRGSSITKNEITEGNIPVIAGGRKPAYFHNVPNRTGQTIVIAGSGAYAGFVSWWEQPIFVSDAFSVKPKNVNYLNSKFCYYFLISKQEQIHKMKSGGGVPHVYPSDIDNFLIPLPPLPVQEEIVRILDTFTELEAELEAEQEARKKQYEYYRNKLLTPVEIHGKWYLNDKEVEWKRLGEIGTLIRGSGLQKKDFTENGVGCIHYGQIYTYYGTFADRTISFVSETMARKLKKAQKGDVLISGVSENIEDICKPIGWLGDEICISGDMFAFRHNQNTKYITYLLQTNDFKNYKRKYAQGTKVIRVKPEKILNYNIPIPPLSEQERIVEILDKFDALVNDLTAGLPAEIAARRKQYEYYRNRLLTFPAKKISDVAINENQS